MPSPLPPDATVFFDGQFCKATDARFALEERGVLFADGVYEVVRYDAGRPFAMQPHVDRLANSLKGIDLRGVDAQQFATLSDELMDRNGLNDAKVYWQVTRGDAGPRDFLIPQPPEAETSPNLVLIAYPATPVDRAGDPISGAGHVVEDCRWTKCWIKSLMLLPASLAKTAAKQHGALEAIFERQKPGLEESHITEGGSTNVFIVRDGELHTHPNDGWVLPGITRDVLLDAAQQDLGLTVREQTFTRAEMLAADEVFVCSTTQLNPLTSIDGTPIGDGQSHPLTTKLHHAYLDRIFRG
ncbi:MAG: aminotransferase class IV [Planctomycetota bacterium]